MPSLAAVHSYVQHLQVREPLPPHIETRAGFSMANKVDKGVFEWELDILSKELILNAPSRGTSDFTRWRCFSESVNELKRLEVNTTRHYRAVTNDIFLELYRIAHRQFPWQRGLDQHSLLRYFKIFNSTGVAPILEARLGVSTPVLYRLGLALTAAFLNQWAIRPPLADDSAGVVQEEVSRFLARFSTAIPALRAEIAATQSYDQGYPYSFNPLRIWPLVQLAVNGRPMVAAPIPTFLYWRFTDGIYYELCDAPDFGAGFGSAFQSYVGEVLIAASRGRQVVLSEQQYYVGKDRKDSIDWILDDDTGSVFLECKTKRLRLESKRSIATTAELNQDLDAMATFVTQVYKTIVDAKAGCYSHWKWREGPIYPLIVTLEEWYTFGHRILEKVDEQVRLKFTERGLALELLDQFPYSICSVADLERASRIMSEVGVTSFMSKQFIPEHKYWPMDSVMRDSFPGELARMKETLFPDDFGTIHPALGPRN
jgi:hypothetical protein